MALSRRALLKSAACGGVLGVLGGRLGALRAAGGKIPIALELWSVREEAQKDLPRVLGAVAEMGYQGVELAHSDYGHDGETWRKLLDKNGLKVAGMHTLLPKLQGVNYDKMIEFQQAIGNRNLILAALPKQSLETLDKMAETAKMLDEMAAKLASVGMRIGYHCHGGDFKPVDGQIPWDVLGSKTSRNVIMQIDVGNCLEAGGDYLGMLKKFADRAVTIHLKEAGEKGVVIGEGKINWPEVFRLCETAGATEWYIVEDESRKGPESLDAVRKCLKNLRAMGK